MAKRTRKHAPPRRAETEEEEPTCDELPADGDSEEGESGLVGRLFRRSVGAPSAALKGLGEQFNGWKSEFMQIFQAEIRRFLDRIEAGEELKKVIEGKRLEISASIRLVDDDGGESHRKKSRN